MPLPRQSGPAALLWETAAPVASVGPARPELSLCTLFTLRYEAPYLLPFVAYHMVAGFDHVYLYHDDLTPAWDTPLLRSLIEMLRMTPSVTLIPVSVARRENSEADPSASADNTNVQKVQLHHCTRHAKRNTVWMGSWDVDEFPVFGAPMVPADVRMRSRTQPVAAPRPGAAREFVRAQPARVHGVMIPRVAFSARTRPGEAWLDKVLPPLPPDGALEVEWLVRRVGLNRQTKPLWRAAGNVAGAYDVHQLTTTEPGVIVLPDGTLADETWYDTELGKHYKTSMDQDKAAAKGVGNRTSVPMRLHHYQLRSLAECTWKRTCANAQDTDGNHGDGGGWRGETECISNNGENDDESEVDMSAVVYVNATRATMLSLFGKGGLQLQSQLAAWWTQQMRAVTAGELPDFIVQEMRRARRSADSFRAVPPRSSGGSTL